MPVSPAFAFPVLVADIGGTNARFAVVEADGDGFRDLGRTPTAAHSDPVAAIRDFVLPRLATPPRSAVLAVAAPIEGDVIPFTNCPWVLEPRRLVAELGLETVAAMNDFAAQALSLPVLGPADEVAIGSGRRRDGATRVVVGPGTGLGVALLVHAGGTWVPVPGEGGHVSFAPDGAREEAIWHALAEDHGRVCAETVISGGGLVRLETAIRRIDGLAPLDRDPAAVVAAADAGEPSADEALDVFVAALGRFAGDLALLALPHGGVHIAGGIPPRILPRLAAGRFRAAFEDKPPYRDLMAGFATSVMVHPAPALLGLAAWARRPDRFAFDLEGRLWTA